MLFALALPHGKRRAAVFVRNFSKPKTCQRNFLPCHIFATAPATPPPRPAVPRAPDAAGPLAHPAISATTRAFLVPAALTASAALPTPPPILTNEVGARYRQNPYCGVRKPLASVWELSYKPWFPRAAREILAAGYQVEGKQVPLDI